ncbi:unnamed protein product [Ectocarpus sp. 12 AP-2014]
MSSSNASITRTYVRGPVFQLFPPVAIESRCTLLVLGVRGGYTAVLVSSFFAHGRSSCMRKRGDGNSASRTPRHQGTSARRMCTYQSITANPSNHAPPFWSISVFVAPLAFFSVQPRLASGSDEK